MNDRDLLTKDDLRSFARSFKRTFTALLITHGALIVSIVTYLK